MLALLTVGVAAGQGVITTIVGKDHFFPRKPVPALQAPIGAISGIAIDQKGNVYFCDFHNHLVLKLDKSGILTILAGNGIPNNSGDGGPATRAALLYPENLAVDSADNIFIVHPILNLIRRVTPDGTITRMVGNGTGGESESAPVVNASLDHPGGVAVDTTGNLFIVDSYNNRIRKVTPDGIVTTVAGNGTRGFSGDGGPAPLASLDLSGSKNDQEFWRGIAVDQAGVLYFGDKYNNRVRKIAPDGTITTVAGDGRQENVGDGLPASNASINQPASVTLDVQGNLFVASGNRIRKVNLDGVISTVAGDGTSALLSGPSGVTVDAEGNLFIADTGNARVRMVPPDGTISTVAGNGAPFFSGDRQPALLADINNPYDVTSDGDGNVFIADTGNFRIRKVRPDGTITTIAGNGAFGFFGDGGPATEAGLLQPFGVTPDDIGNVFVLDLVRIRKVTPEGTISTVAGNGNTNSSGDGELATKASFYGALSKITADHGGNLYFSDRNGRVRNVASNGIITTVAGNGISGFSGDGGRALNASLSSPEGVALDPAGNLFVADSSNNRIRKVTPDGIITTVAGNGFRGFSGDGGPAISASLSGPKGLNADVNGNLFIADFGNNRIRKLALDGTITTAVGYASGCGALRDGGLAVHASLCGPTSVAVTADGGLLIADSGNNRIRAVLASPPSISAGPQELSFAGRAGGVALTNQVVTVKASVPGVPLNISATTLDGGPWLAVEVASATTPRVIEITADPFSLAPGEYSGVITIESPLATPSLTTIPVSLTVGPGAAPSLSVDRTAISFTFPRGAPARAETIRVSNAGGGSLDFFAVTSTEAGGNWLTLAPPSGTAKPSAAVPVFLTANPAGLRAGTYRGKVAIGATSVQNAAVIPITMTISNNPAAVLLSQTGLSFTAVEGGGVVPPQNFGVMSLGATALPFSVETSTLSGGTWLTAGAPTAASTVDVSVDTTNLPAGRYYGLVQVKAPGAANSPQLITSHLDVLPRGTDLGGVLQPNELTFNAVLARSSPGSQSVLVYNLTASPKTFRVAASDDWIRVVPQVATVMPNEPVELIVQPILSSLVSSPLYLKEGTHRSAVTLQFDDGRVRTVRITAIVVPPPGSPSTKSVSGVRARQAAPGCQATELIPAVTSLGGGFSVPAGWPVALQVQVQDDCGNPLDTGSVITEFSNGDVPLVLTALGNGRWDGTWQSNVGQKGVTITVKAATVDGQTKGVKQVSGGFSSETLPPVISAGGVADAASGVAFQPLSPGSLITISGDRLADQSITAPGFPLGTSLANASVVLAGKDLPLASVSPNQLVAIVPYDIETNTRHQLLITRGNTYSQLVTVNLADVSPAVFVKGGTQGNIVDAMGNLVAPGNAAKAGDVVSIYSTGLGILQPDVKAGDAGPVSSSTVNPISVSIGGKRAAVSFSGLAPGLAGVYLVRATVPDGVATGDRVPVIVSSETDPPAVSQSVTMAIRP